MLYHIFNKVCRLLPGFQCLLCCHALPFLVEASEDDQRVESQGFLECVGKSSVTSSKSFIHNKVGLLVSSDFCGGS